MPLSGSAYNNAPSFVSGILLCTVIASTILLSMLPGGNLVNLGIAVLFVGVVLFNVIAGKRAMWLSAEVLVLIGWLCFSIVGTLMALDTDAAMFKSLTMLQILVFAFCIQQVVLWNRDDNSYLVAYGIAIGASYLLTFTGISAQEIAGADEVAGDVSRVASTLNDENTFGAVSLMGFSLVTIALAQNTKKALVLPLSILLLLLLVAVFNSGSRTAFLGAILVLAGSVWAFQLWRGASLLKFSVAAAFALAISGALFFAAKSIPEVQERIDAVFSVDSTIASRVEGFIEVLVSGDTRAEQGDSIDSRVEMMANGLAVIGDNPIFGVGLDNFRTVTGAGTYAHSNLIEVGTSTGVIGFVIYHLMYLVLTIRIFRLMSAKGAPGVVARLALVGLMAYFLMDITRVSYYEKTSWLYFAALGALIEQHLRVVKEGKLAQSAPRSKRRRRRRRKKISSATTDSSGSADEFEDIDDLFSANPK